MRAEEILRNTLDELRLSATGAVIVFENAPLASVCWAADRVCVKKHPGGVRTYIIDRNINYTNVCVSACRFCAFYRKHSDEDAYVLTTNQVLEKVGKAVELGATQILMQGGLHPELGISHFEDLFKAIKSSYTIRLHSLSAPEIAHIARVSGLSIQYTLERLKAAGLDSIPGGGAEILVDSVRKQISPKKCTKDEWLNVMREAGKLGMRATATMLFGMGETCADRIEHLEAIRALQDETNIFTAFIPWTFQPGNTALGGSPAGSHEYLRTLAVSRLFLDNIENIQASWVTQGGGIAQLALKSGANDIGSTMIEENVVAAAGCSHRMSESDLIGLIHAAGFDSAQRSTNYDIIKTHPRNGSV